MVIGSPSLFRSFRLGFDGVEAGVGSRWDDDGPEAENGGKRISKSLEIGLGASFSGFRVELRVEMRSGPRGSAATSQGAPQSRKGGQSDPSRIRLSNAFVIVI